jgi:hypothetical protein
MHTKCVKMRVLPFCAAVYEFNSFAPVSYWQNAMQTFFSLIKRQLVYNVKIMFSKILVRFVFCLQHSVVLAVPVRDVLAHRSPFHKAISTYIVRHIWVRSGGSADILFQCCVWS